MKTVTAIFLSDSLVKSDKFLRPKHFCSLQIQNISSGYSKAGNSLYHLKVWFICFLPSYEINFLFISFLTSKLYFEHKTVEASFFTAKKLNCIWMSEATRQPISCKTVFEMFYLCVWMESTHFLHIVEKQCKMKTGYFQHYWWDTESFTLILIVLA